MSEIEYCFAEQIEKSPKYPFSIHQLRHFFLHRHKNGLNGAVCKIGKRIVVRMDLFDAWIEQQKGGR
jgi:hypothetical protein